MLALTLAAELQGVVDLVPVDTAENAFYYMFKIECTSCRTKHDSWVSISRHESVELPKGKGVFNFMWRCKECKREHTATISSGPHPYGSADGPNKPAQILQVDCRGLELLDFKPEGQWAAKGTESGKPFEFEFEEGEWFDYDDKAKQEVSVKDLKFSITRA